MRISLAAALLAATPLAAPAFAQPAPPHNVVLFVADGLRGGIVSEELTPNIAALMKRGVRFDNTHSLFPTFTTANASAMATGHYLGDTGDFSNTIYTAFPVPGAGDSLTPFLESDPVLGDVDEHFSGNYLNETAILKAARDKGFSTATIGKLGPALIFDHTERTGAQTVELDDSTGSNRGIPLSPEMQKRLADAGLPLAAPSRGANGKAGDFQTPGTVVANVEQQNWFADAATKAVLPMFRERGKPFALVFWSRDPDGTQHNQGDSLGRLVPGINGPSSLASIRNADDDLGKLEAGLKALGLFDTTDIVVTSDHGFSTISKESATSFAASQHYKDVTPNQLPMGFVAIDIAHGLGKTLFDPDAKGAVVGENAYPSKANGLIGGTPQAPEVVVATNGGSDLIYIPNGDKELARKIVQVLAAQDYTSGLFVASSLGAIPGTLPLDDIGLEGSAVTPMPAIAINFRTFSTGCADPTVCGVEVADTVLQQGQGMHGTFGRSDTRNAMGAAGPGFKAGFVDPAPASNADFGKTIFHLLGLTPEDKGKLVGRVLAEALAGGGEPPASVRDTKRSAPDEAGRITVLNYQTVGATRYFDAAGYPGRTLGLTP